MQPLTGVVCNLNSPVCFTLVEHRLRMTLALSLLGLLVVPSALGVVDSAAAQTCKKVGLATKNKSGTALICKKVGKKLVWKKSTSTTCSSRAS